MGWGLWDWKSCGCAGHLPDAGGGEGLVVEVGEQPPPLVPQLARELAVQLLRRHVLGLLAHPVDHRPQW